MAHVMRYRLSKLFQPLNIVPKNATVKYDDITSVSQKLMVDWGIIRQAQNGLFYLLPLGERSLRKLITIVDGEMKKVDAQKVMLPSLVSSSLWKKSGRLESAATELFKLQDRHGKEFILSPTHEECITELFSSVSPVSYRQLPVRLYQITSKFRDEIKPRFGLLRAKEFIMKDLYTFDLSSEKAKETYEAITACYEEIFRKIGVKYVRVAGLTGLMGGSLSHEFHFPSSVGEDKLILCQTCGHGNNAEVSTFISEKLDNADVVKCPNCGSLNHRHAQGIEVGHTFLLGKRYSKALGAHVLQENGKPEAAEMGCYGLGLTRILAASLECLSNDKEMRWPLSLAPFKVCIIPPKGGSKEDKSAPNLNDILCQHLEQVPWLCDDFIVDDRLHLTVGKRLMEAKCTGYPLIVVLGKSIAQPEPLIEVHSYLSGEEVMLPLQETVNFIAEHSNMNGELGVDTKRLSQASV